MIIKKLGSAVLSCAVACSLFAFIPERTFADVPAYISINENTFPDYNFRRYVNANIDTLTPYAILTPDEIRGVTSLDVYNMEISDLTGIRIFTELTELRCGSNSLGSLDVSGMSNLRRLYCSGCGLTTLNVSGCSNLQELYISKNEFTSLEFGTDCPALRMLDCEYNTRLTSLDVSGLPALTKLECSNTRLTSLDVKENTALRTLLCNFVPMEYLDVSGMTSLRELTCRGSYIESVNVTNCPNLSFLDVGGTFITELDLTGDTNLDDLDASDCMLEGLLSLNDCPSMSCLQVQGDNDLLAIDIRNVGQLIHTYETCSPGIWDRDYYDDGTNVVCLEYKCRAENGVSYSAIMRLFEDVIVITTDEQYDEYIASLPTPAPAQDDNGGSSSDDSSSSGSTPAPAADSSSSGSGSSAAPANSSSTAPAASSEPGVGGFVDRLYSVALERDPDPAGRADWVAAITERGETGASAARGFLYSPEFLNKQVTNEEFVRVLYRTFFDREPDTEGFNAWVAALNNGASKEEVIEGFINSTEWANLCLYYGIASGGTGVPNIEVEPNQQTIDFCTRLYTTCLNRNSDQEGLMAWARQLANRRDSGSGAARGFFFSSEFIGQNVSNSEYVTRLYRTFMGREPDEAGFTAWVAQLDEGVSRDVVFAGFAESPEFTRICASYGIVR